MKKNLKTASLKEVTGNCAAVANSNKKPIGKMKINQESSDALWNKIEIDKNLSDIRKKMKVLKYVDDKLYYTEDLSIFKKCDYNRDIAIKGAMKIINSVKKCGTWINHVVVVNSLMEVISGQNTLVAAKLLGIGVTYIISEDHNPELLVQQEVGNRWTDLANLKTYAKTNRTSQKFLKYFFDTNKELKKEKVINKNGRMVTKYKNITLPQLLAIVYKQPKFVYGLKANGGAHHLNKLNDFNNKSEETLIAIKIVALAQKVCTGDGIKRYPFLIGMLNFMFDNQEGIVVDFNRLLNKIPVLKVTAGRPEDYYEQIRKVYS